jgi:hypothetical protein
MTIGTEVTEDALGASWGAEDVPGGLLGSYGLQLVGEGELRRALAAAGHWMLRPDPSWPEWHIEWSPSSHGAEGEPPPNRKPFPGGDELLEDRARLAASAAGGWIELDRNTRRTRFSMPEPIAPAALVHPYLTSTGAIAAHWLGRTPFHAGGFSLDGRAWGVLGGRQMGKSSLLMGLHTAGVPVVSDDLMVVAEDRVYSGPRCLDLRRTAAERFGAGNALGRVGRRDRWRVDLPTAPGELPLAGWIVLGWSDDVRIEPISAGQGLAALAMNRAVIARGEVPRGLLDAVTHPVILFSRPRDWSKLDHGLDELLEHLSGQ